MSTPHISAEMGDFAKTVLMPGARQKRFAGMRIKAIPHK